MSFNFPATPAYGDYFNSGVGPIWRWNGGAWELATSIPVAITSGLVYSVAENISAITTLTATGSGDITWTKSGGADTAKFTLTTAGVLTFTSAPNFEAPTDANADNVYVVQVQASNGITTDAKTISVTVTDVVETDPTQTLDLDFTVFPMAAAPGVADPYFGNVVYLSGYDGADASTTTIDEATAKTVTTVGNAQIDTAQFKFGASSLLLDGTGDYLTLADHADWSLGSGPFTIEAWVRPAADSSTNVVISHAGTSVQRSFYIYLNQPNVWMAISENGSSVQTIQSTIVTGLVTPNVWHHIAVDRDASNNVRLYVDGVMSGKGTVTYSVFDSPGLLQIGALTYAPWYFNGWIDEVRFTKGVARYASDSGYTVPTAAFPRWGSSSTGLDPRITFSRASLGTYYDSAGVLRHTAHNLIYPSSDFTSAGWPKTRITVTADAIAAPDGSMTADRLNMDNPGGQAFVQRSGVSLARRACLSVYAKAGTKNWIMLSFTLGNAAATCWFNVSTGAVGTKGASWATSAIENVGNGWYRCSGTADIASFTTLLICVGDADNTLNANVTGDVYMWGAQFEEVTIETAARTYMPTTTAVNYNAPRFDFDPVTHAAKGLLIEEARGNFSYSQDFTQAGTWAKTGLTVTADQIVAPDGTTTADLLTASASPATIDQGLSVGLVAYTQSVFAKKGTSNWFYLCALITATATQAPKAYFNLNTGTVGTVEAGITAATIQDVGNGWYRCVVSSVGTAGTERHQAGLCDADNSTTVTVGRTIYLWGAQMETGAFPTSYIPTASSAGSRAADVAVMTGSNFSSWYNQPQGTFVFEGVFNQSSGGNTQGVMCADEVVSGSQSLRFQRGFTNANITLTAGSTQANANFGSFTNGAIFKMGAAFALNNVGMCKDGGTVATDTAANMCTPTMLRIGMESSAANPPVNGYVRRIRFWNTRKSDAELQALTT